MASPLTPFWPTDGIALRTPRLLLEPLQERHFAALLEAVLAGVHDPATMPFATPWTDAPREDLVRSSLVHWWQARAAVAPDDWELCFVVQRDGVPIGTQSLRARSFAVRRTVSTGSWLTRSVHGRGLGTEMRAAVLLLAVDHLGAQRAETEAFADNPASIAVTRRLGYRDNGTSLLARRGVDAENLRFVLRAPELVRPDWQLAVTGVDEAVLRALGAPGPQPSEPAENVSQDAGSPEV